MTPASGTGTADRVATATTPGPAQLASGGAAPAEHTAAPEHAAAGQGPAEKEHLLGIGAAAARAGVSERALRYYQQLGLIVPARTTPAGTRRYGRDDLARVARIRELQTLLGLNLDEIAVVLRNEDRMAQIRLSYHDERTSQEERQRLIRECLVLQEDLRVTVEAKRVALEGFLSDLDARIGRAKDLLASTGGPAARQGSGATVR
jgi:MerR family transcriptional regulator, repressor of the yfmOP operon